MSETPTPFKPIQNHRDRLIFALDVPTPDDAKGMVNDLGDAVTFYKVGLELFMAGGYWELVDWLKAREKRVFVDLKFFDVPKTVERCVAQLSGRGVDFATVHGNDSIMRGAVEGSKAGDGSLGVLAVTMLTSLDAGDIRDLGFDCDPGELVLSRAKRALELGCAGVISSGLEAPALRENLDERLLVVTPGIRPVENKPVDDQKRTVDVAQAFENGADHIVVGRPIRDAENPKAAAEAIQKTIAGVFA